jgi:NADH-quinone oxidoreductase subunit A
VGQYLPIFAMLVLAIIFAVVSRVVSQLLAPRRPSEAKSSPYECGIVPEEGPPDRFPVKFFLVAMIFIVFDIGNGALDWGPVKRLRRSEAVSPARTATSTIRRVGLEGRSTEEAA